MILVVPAADFPTLGNDVCRPLDLSCQPGMALTCSSFIEENNAYKNHQKQLQHNQRMPPGMPSQEMMAYWGTAYTSSRLCFHH